MLQGVAWPLSPQPRGCGPRKGQPRDPGTHGATEPGKGWPRDPQTRNGVKPTSLPRPPGVRTPALPHARAAVVRASRRAAGGPGWVWGTDHVTLCMWGWAGNVGVKALPTVSPQLPEPSPWEDPCYGQGQALHQSLADDQPRQHIKKQRHYFGDKGPSNQSCTFSSDHVWMLTVGL